MPGIQEEIRAALGEQATALAAFRETHERELAEIRAEGVASAETVAQVARANEAIQAMQTTIRNLETQLARPINPEAGDPNSPQARAMRAGFLNLLRGRPVDPDIRAALIEDTTGEILVPEDIEAGIRRTRADENIMRQLANVRPTTSNRVRRRSLTELNVGWGKLETGASLVETTPTPTNATVNVEDLYGLIRVGEDELADTDVNLQDYIEDSFGRAIGDKEETGFVLGLGHASAQPEGFTLGSTVTRINAGQAGAITADDILTLMFGVKSSYRRSGALLINSTTELAVRKFKDDNGQYLWQPSLQAGSPPSFNGRPVYNQEDLVNIPSAGTAADVAAFGDWKVGYEIVDRLGVSVKVLRELYASQGMVGFLAHSRVTGYVSDSEALRILRVPAS